MSEVIQNVLYIFTQGAYVSRDHLTLRIEVEKELKLAIPIHHIESVCVFGQVTLSHGAMRLCAENGAAVSFLSEHGFLQARVAGVPDSSVGLRRAHFRAADDPTTCLRISRNMIAGKLQNARNSLLRAGRENTDPDEAPLLADAAHAHANMIESLPEAMNLDALRGFEGAAAQAYFGAFSLLLKQGRDNFHLSARSKHPPRDRINCLLSFLYALVRHDCIAGLTAIGLDPFVGFFHVERPNRPALALDLMEEFRPWLADRLAITLVNRQQLNPRDFREHEGGAFELTEAGRKTVVKAYQERKQEKISHPFTDCQHRIGQLPFIQARILARVLRGDLEAYIPFIPK